MISRLIRKLTVSRRIFGGFLLVVMLFAMATPFILKDHQLLLKRVQQVTHFDSEVNRLLLLASKRIESSRLNLMRFLQNYIPSNQESLNDVLQATQLLAEARKLLIVEEQSAVVKQVIETVTEYQSLIQQIGIQRRDANALEINRLVFTALKTGNDIGLQIENIVEKNEDRVAEETRVADIRIKNSLLMLMAYFAGVLLLSIVLASFVGRSVTLPISELRKSAESFQQGRTDFALSVMGNDELSLLAQTFNQMTTNIRLSEISQQKHAAELEEELSQRKRAEEELQRYQANLEDLVKNRTSELSKAVDQLSNEISERGRTENALKESEERVQTILSAINTGIVIIDPETRIIIDVNPAAAQMIGLEREGIIGQVCHQFICPKAMNDCPVLDHDQKVDHSERILVTAKGNNIPILKTVSAVNLSGKMHLLESFIDISEQKKVQEAIRESEEKTSIFFNGTNDGLLILSPEKGFQHANGAAVKMFGAETLADLLRCGPVEISPELQPDGRNSLYSAKEHIAQAIKSGAAHRFEWMHRRFDGSPLPCEITLIPIMLASENQLLVSIRDITERKQSEEELKQRMEELERFSRLTINREEKMIQLKGEVNMLLEQQGREKKYKIADEKNGLGKKSST